MSRRPRATLWVGPIAFAAVMMGIAGLFNVLLGFTAAFSDEVYVGGPNLAVGLDVTTWGWVHVVVGALLGVTAIGVLGGVKWARLTAVALLGINMVTHMFLVPAYDKWSLIIIALDGIIIWALLVHGEELG